MRFEAHILLADESNITRGLVKDATPPDFGVDVGVIVSTSMLCTDRVNMLIDE